MGLKYTALIPAIFGCLQNDIMEISLNKYRNFSSF